jgi:hypothetical protein
LRAIESSWGKLKVFEVYGKYFKTGESLGGFCKVPPPLFPFFMGYLALDSGHETIARFDSC